MVAGNDYPLQPEDIRDRIKELIGNIGRNFFELGQHIYEVKHRELYLDWGHGSWVEYCETEVGVGKRTAENWMSIWEKLCQKLGYTWNEVEHIGWSRLSRVVPMIETKRDANRWLKKAEQHSKRELETLVRRERQSLKGDQPEEPRPPVERISHDLEEELRDSHQTVDVPFVNPNTIHHETIDYEDDSGEKIPLHEFKVYLFPEQWTTVQSAMDRAAQLGNTEKPGQMLHLISTEFNTTYASDGDGGLIHRLEYHRQELEKLYGVEIEITVPEGSELRRMSRLPEKSTAKPAKKAREFRW